MSLKENRNRFTSYTIFFKKYLSFSFLIHLSKLRKAPVQTSAPRTTVTKSVSSNTTKVPAVPKSAPESAVKFTDKEAVKADIADVRSDATETNWYINLTSFLNMKGCCRL